MSKYENASIILPVAPGVKAGKVYCLKPTSGQDFTYDRGGADNATRVNSSGLIEDLAEDVPRLDYSDGTCPSLLLEPSTTNLVTYSEDFSNAAWAKTRTTITSNAINSPKGDLSADKLVEDTSNNNHFILETAGVVSNNETFSVFAKADERSWIYLQSGGSEWSYFDVGNGVVGTSNNCTSKIEDYGNGWYRCSISFTRTINTNNLIFLAENDNTNIYLGDGASGVYIWGAQLEQQSYATSYVPSLLGVNGVRNAETCNGAGSTAEINSTEGVLFFEGRALADDGILKTLSLSEDLSTNDNRILLGYSEEGNIFYYMQSGNVIQFNLKVGNLDITNNNKVALSYKVNDCKVYLNGLLISAVTSATMPSNLQNLNTANPTGSSQFHGRVKQIQYYNDTTEDLEALTGFTSFAEMKNYLSYE